MQNPTIQLIERAFSHWPELWEQRRNSYIAADNSSGCDFTFATQVPHWADEETMDRIQDQMTHVLSTYFAEQQFYLITDPDTGLTIWGETGSRDFIMVYHTDYCYHVTWRSEG